LKVAAEVEKKIINIMKGNKIDFKKTSVNIMPIYSQIMFELNSEAACDDILNNKINIFENIYSEKTAILIRGNTITFEILNKSPSKISYKSLFLRSPKNKLPLGLSIDKKVALLNFDDSKNTFIAGEKGSGTTMVMITIIISFAYTSNPKNSEIIILEDEKQTSSLLKTFEKLPHLIKKDTFGNAKCKSTIESFIGNQANKKTLIVFNLYDEFTKVSNVHKELLIKLLEYANKNKNVLVVLTTQSVNNDSASEDIYKEFSNKLLLRTKTEQESIDIIGNPRAYQLFGYGDCLFVNKDGEKDRIQTCYISKNEINSIIAVITTFFNTLNN
jgi:DNA segregation ATPase FtsK/SpoIIIE-like protein